jgi:hypothetical protein
MYSVIFTGKANKNTIVFFVTTGLSVLDIHCVLRSALYVVRRRDQNRSFDLENVRAQCGLGLDLIDFLTNGLPEDGLLEAETCSHPP